MMSVVQIARVPAGMFARLRARSRTRALPFTTTAALLLSAGGLLLGGGLIMILSSSWVSAYQRYGSSFLFFGRQLAWAIVGVIALWLTARTDYRKLRIVAYLLLAVSIAGLILVLHPAIGTRVGGSSRWLVFGPLRFQPSELAKLALVLAGADLCARKGSRLRTFKDVLVPYGIIALLIGGLVMAQPDMGTAVILAGIVFVTLFLAGVRIRVLGGLGLLGVGAMGVMSMSEGYRRERLLSFLNPFGDPLNAGYQAVQARIALGSGGLFGVGLGASRQKWMYVPNAHTDFIYAIIGEEVGLVGTLAVILLFGLLAYAGIRAARRAPDAYGRIVAGALTAWIVGQAAINMGAVTGLLPITGVPLPLVSFGGSSLVFTLAALGVLLNIARQEQWPPAKASEPARRPRKTTRTASERARTTRSVSGRKRAAPVARVHPARQRRA